MSKRNALFLLTLSALLFAFAAGVLVSRPVTAQSVVGYPGMPMRQADLWSYRVQQQSYGQFLTALGQPIEGYEFTVHADAAGRLPVVTSVAGSESSAPGRLWIKQPDGTLRVLADSRQDYSGGFILEPGEYVVSFGWYGNPLSAEVVLVGYWARP